MEEQLRMMAPVINDLRVSYRSEVLREEILGADGESVTRSHFIVTAELI